MAVSKPQTRFAHIDGHTDVCYDDSGKYLLTAGADGDVRVWNGFDDDNAVSHRAGDCVYGIVLKGKRLYTAADNNVVQIYTFPELSADGIVTRCTSRITHFSLNSSGSHMAVCSSDFDIKYVEIESNAQKVFEGHTAPVLSVAVDPRSEFLASSACDGLVKVWHIPTQKPVSNMKLLNSCSDVSLAESLCRMSWSPPSGATLAVPTKGKVELYQRSSWKKVEELVVDGIDKHFNVVAFSPDGRFLCGATTDGWIVLWSAATGSSWILAKKWKQPKVAAVTALAWNPATADAGELCFADSQGQFGIIQKVTEGLIAKPPAAATAQPVTAGSGGAQREAKPAGGRAGEPDGPADGVNGSGAAQDGGDSSDDEDAAHIRRLRELVGITHSAAEATSAVGDDDDNDDVDSLSSGRRPADVTAHHPAAAKAEARPSQAPAAVAAVPQQLPFKPGSTPVGLQSRFMVWNSVGVVRQYVGDGDEDSSIDVEFHDTSVHHSLHLSNNAGYSMADLSKEALLLASDGDADSGASAGSADGSQLFCMHFGSWDAAKEWAVSMPDGERIEALALSDRWLAAATSRRTVRLFTTCGSQLGTFSVGGRVVAMAAQGRSLMVAYHRGAVASGDQYLAVELVEIKGRMWRNLCNRDLPLSPCATLSWLGFSDEGTPVAYDSAGVLRLLSQSLGILWVEISNLKAQVKGRSDNYWLVGVSEQSRQARCVYCRGSTFPPTLPRPVISLQSFQMPFCEMLNEKGQLEEKVWQNRVLGGCARGAFVSQLDDDEEATQYDRQESCLRDEQAALIKLFAMACKSEREYRALQLCELMPTVRALESAAKYATHLRRADLVRRINELIATREAVAAADDAGSHGTAAAQSYGHSDALLQSRHNNSGAADHDDHGLSQSAAMDSLNDSQRSLNSSADAESGEPKKRLLLAKRTVASTPKPTAPLMPLSQGLYKNPFKLGPVDTPPSGSRGSSVFDSIERAQPTKETSVKSSDGKNKSSSGVQCRLFEKMKADADTTKPSTTTKPTTAFDLWLAENEESIRAKAGDGDSVLALATEAFQQLPREEKKKWMARTKSLPSGDDPKKRKTEDVENGCDSLAANSSDSSVHCSKRQSPDGEDASASATRKQPLTSGGNAQTKLAAFAFAKQGSS